MLLKVKEFELVGVVFRIGWKMQRITENQFAAISSSGGILSDCYQSESRTICFNFWQ